MAEWNLSHRQRRSVGGFALAVLVLTLCCTRTQPTSAQEPTAVQAALAMEQLLVDAIARSQRSVVAIARVRKGSEGDPTDPQFVPHEFGTGVVVDSRGLILTNYHVLGDPRENDYYVWTDHQALKVRHIEPAQQVQAADPWTDLAVLKVDADDLVPITFGDASTLKKGQIVISLGNPYAIARDGQPSATWGIVSNLSRKATDSPTADRLKVGDTLHHYGTLIQTDAKLNLGTSGGALLNLKGEMIGLTTSLAAMERYEKAAGFAIPVDDAFKKTVETLKAGRSPEFGFLGVGPRDLDAIERREGRAGVFIEQVVFGTPAAQVGLRPGDVITHVNGMPTADASELMRDLGRLSAGTNVLLTVIRGTDGRVARTPVTLSKKYIQSSRPAFAQVADPAWRGLRVDYATAIPFFQDQSRYVDPEGCIAIADVQRDSPAWKAGLRPRSFISHVGRQRVATPAEFYTAVTGKTGSVDIRLTASLGDENPVRIVSP